MADLQIIAVETAEALRGIAEQSLQLGRALQNAAPATAASPSHSIQYLLTTSDALNKLANACAELGPVYRQAP